MSYRDVAKALRSNGCTDRPGKGSHVVWTCPNGKHHTTVPQHKGKDVSPGVIRTAIQRMTCLPEGWLQ